MHEYIPFACTRAYHIDDFVEGVEGAVVCAAIALVRVTIADDHGCNVDDVEKTHGGALRMYGCMDGCMDVCMYGWMDGWMDECMNGWMHGWMDGWMDEWMDEWMDGCMGLVIGIGDLGLRIGIGHLD